MALLEDQAQFVYHFRMDGDPEDMLVTVGIYGDPMFPPDVATAEIGYDVWISNLLAVVSSAVSLVAVDCELGTPLGVLSATFTPTTPAEGGKGVPSLPPNVALLARKLTGGVGRGKNGRMYLPGPAQADVNGAGDVDTLVVGEFQTALNDYFDDMTAAGPELVVNHQASSPLSPSSAVTSFSAQSRVATQRRRLRP